MTGVDRKSVSVYCESTATDGGYRHGCGDCWIEEEGDGEKEGRGRKTGPITRENDEVDAERSGRESAAFLGK